MLPKEIGHAEEDVFHISSETMNYDDRVKVLNHCDSFAIFDRWGDIHPKAKKAQGIFHKGTRFLNRLELKINKKKPLLLSSAIKENNDILSVDLTNPDLVDCNLAENIIHISRSQFIGDGTYYEEITLASYSEEECQFDISLFFGADFKDLFEIRGMKRTVETNRPHAGNNDDQVFFDYMGLDHIHRRTVILFSGNNNYELKNNAALFPVKLKPHHRKKISYTIVFETEEGFLSKEEKNEDILDFDEARKHLKKELKKTRELFAGITTSNEQFTHWINRSRADLITLLTPTPDGLYPYAGVPWYHTPFGRDGIITAMEVLWIAPEIARNVLVFLAKLQATEVIPSMDAEPGKILHEARSGEMANTGEIPFRRYYGTIDATPLFLMLAGKYYRQTGDLETIRHLWPNIQAALYWIDHYGDLDGDGFVEYKHKAANGLTNQGWKDSHDSVMYRNGDLCEPPIALCEVQGYVYAAKYHASVLASALDEKSLAVQLQEQAEALKKKFNEVFWDESSHCYALALDANKKPCRVVSSNPGHCLFTGIVSEKHAADLAETLMGEEMFSGWGIRTLSAKEKRYNPMSYHNGSIWPHDNALIAEGLAKYGFQKEALKILSVMFEASLFIDMQRLPELFCGFERRLNEGPTAYPVACSPQAWSVAAVFLLLQSCLRLEIDALHKTIVFDKPQLPEFIEKITITHLKTGDSFCHFEMYRHEFDIAFNVISKPDDWEIMIRK